MDHVVVAGGTESLSTSPQALKRLAGPGGDPVPWMSPSHPETPDAPDVRHVDHGGREHVARDGPHPPRRRRVGAATAPRTRCGRSTRAAFEAGDRAGAGGRPRRRGAHVRGRRAPAPRHDDRDAGARCRCSTPRSRASPSPPATRPGSTTRAAAVVVVVERLRGGARAHAARPHPVVGVGRPRAGAHGHGPDARDPEGARPGRAVASGDIDLWEINEAFCSVPVAASRKLGIPQEIMNVNGSGASLGHPIACTGARMVVTMVNELRRRGKTLGCVSMCAGGGMGSALVLEVSERDRRHQTRLYVRRLTPVRGKGGHGWCCMAHSREPIGGSERERGGTTSSERPVEGGDS